MVKEKRKEKTFIHVQCYIRFKKLYNIKRSNKGPNIYKEQSKKDLFHQPLNNDCNTSIVF